MSVVLISFISLACCCNWDLEVCGFEIIHPGTRQHCHSSDRVLHYPQVLTRCICWVDFNPYCHVSLGTTVHLPMLTIFIITDSLSRIYGPSTNSPFPYVSATHDTRPGNQPPQTTTPATKTKPTTDQQFKVKPVPHHPASPLRPQPQSPTTHIRVHHNQQSHQQRPPHSGPDKAQPHHSYAVHFTTATISSHHRTRTLSPFPFPILVPIPNPVSPQLLRTGMDCVYIPTAEYKPLPFAWLDPSRPHPDHAIVSNITVNIVIDHPSSGGNCTIDLH